MSDSDCRNQLERYLSIREHSTEELKKKMRAKGYAPAEFEPLLQELQEEGLQSDARFKTEKIRSLILKDYGPRYIQLKLKEFGLEVTRNEVAQAYEELGTSPEEQMQGLISKSRADSPTKQKARLWRRGFDVSPDW